MAKMREEFERKSFHMKLTTKSRLKKVVLHCFMSFKSMCSKHHLHICIFHTRYEYWSILYLSQSSPGQQMMLQRLLSIFYTVHTAATLGHAGMLGWSLAVKSTRIRQQFCNHFKQMQDSVIINTLWLSSTISAVLIAILQRRQTIHHQ